MTVAEYRAEFTRLEGFAPGVYHTEAERAKRFQNGLDLDILSHIASVTYLTLSAIVSAATQQEATLRHQEKRRAEPTIDQRTQHRHLSQPQDQQSEQNRVGGRQQQGRQQTQSRRFGVSSRS